MRVKLLVSGAMVALATGLTAYPATAGKWVEKWLYVPNAITLSDYHSLSDGVSYSQVCKALKMKGKEVSRASSGGFTIVVYVWQNIDGSTLSATFQNDKLLSKAQSGLI